MKQLPPPNGTGRTVALAALAFAVATIPVVTWWLVGDLSEAGSADYMFKAPAILERHEHLIGRSAALVLVVSLVILLSPVGRKSLKRHDMKTSLPLICLGLVLGPAYRMATAAVKGTNIGGAMAFFYGMAFVAAMLILAVIEYRKGRSSREQGDGRSATYKDPRELDPPRPQ